jgi:hypothetical protein
MATAAKGRSQVERRKSGQFDSAYTKEMLYELVGAVAMSVDPVEPVSVSQPRFDRDAPSIASERGWPTPPSARAITMRLEKSWLLIKKEATQNRSIQQVLARAEGVAMAPWLDERFIYFALRRAHLHLGKNADETLYPHDYERARNELLAEARRLSRETYVEELLPTRGQLLELLDDNWNDGLRIAGLPEAERVRRGHPQLKLAEHFYETRKRLPKTMKELRQHATALNISFPHRGVGGIEELIEELSADRATRGLSTPEGGPVESAGLAPKEIAALIEGAPSIRRARPWTEDEVVEAFADFVEEFEGRDRLILATFTAHRVERGWPSNDSWQKYGKFREVVEKGRKRAKERRGRAA